MYKLIAIDLDDTLFTDELTVTDRTKNALQAAQERGVIVTLATGRMFASAKKVAEQIGLNVPLVTYHGSLVKNLVDGTVLYERSVPFEIAAQVYQYCVERGLHLQLFIDDLVYAREVNDKLLEYCRISRVEYVIEPDVQKLRNKQITKMIIIDEPDLLDRIEIELKERFYEKGAPSQVHIAKSKPNLLEFMHPQGTKGDALAFLAAHYGCDLSEVIAIGDSWNDREMIEVAGLGVAMGNAIPALKEIADYVTLSNNDDGVAHVIEKFILQQ